MTPKDLREMTKDLAVLYVEDDVALRHSAKKMFAQFFGNIDEAENGQEGWDLYQKNHYDLVITDINMPVMNGIDMIKHIKETSEYQAIIVTSAYNDSDSLLGLIDLGVDKFLLKPMDLSKLVDCLIHTTFYISNHKDFFSAKNRVAELEEEVKKLRLQLQATTGQKASPTTTSTIKHLLPKEDYALLRALEKKFTKAIYDIQMQGDYPDHLKENILKSLDHYATILFGYEPYKDIAVQLNKLDQSIEKDEIYFENNINSVCELLEDVSKNLAIARKSAYTPDNTKILIKSMMRIMATLRPQ
jgi:YesN/AraC family two-component response regulator